MYFKFPCNSKLVIYAYIQKMLFTELYDKSSHSDEDDELSQMQDIEGAKAENVDQSKDENIDKENKLDQKIEPNSSRVDESVKESEQNAQKTE